MSRIIVQTKVASDGSVHVDLPLGMHAAGTEVQVTVELLAAKRPLLAADLLQSELVGLWAGRTDIADNHGFARQLREQAQTRTRHP
jgi:hypothetical protein